MDDEQKLKELKQELAKLKESSEVENNERNRRFALDIVAKLYCALPGDTTSGFIPLAKDIYQFIKEG